MLADRRRAHLRRRRRPVAARRLSCPDGLGGKAFTVNGLAQTQTDVLLRVDYLDGTASNQRLTPSEPTDDPRAAERARGRAHVSCSASSTSCSASITAVRSALLLIVKGIGRLVATVTAFTVAHSITLGAATLGFVHVPSAPVEAVIALSILFLASSSRGNAPAEALPPHGEPDAAVPVGNGVLVRLAAWLRLRGRLERGRHAAASRAARALVLQRRRRARPASVHRRRVRLRVARAALGRARARVLAARRRIRRRSVSAFWVVERTIAVF